MQYLELPVATLLGYLVFEDFPNSLTLTGIIIIIGTGLYVIHRERVTARQLMTERAAPPI
jgi:drug/metabolite transporter (DMT)-like permease